MGKGTFVTFEGIEGSGKSLQLQLLCDVLSEQGIDFIRALEPGGTPFGQELRRVLLRADGAAREPIAELLLYLADRYQHIQTVIEPALGRGSHVLCDRYHDATLAYQGFARGLGLEQVDSIARALKLLVPDLTIIFDLDVAIGLRRARKRNLETSSEKEGRFEAEKLTFHERVREGYLELARREPERIIVVDASRSIEAIHREVLDIVKVRL